MEKYLEQYQQIAEILEEAESYHLRREVIDLARGSRLFDQTMPIVDSYELALKIKLANVETEERNNEY